MDIGYAVVKGVIQGLTEFLPVSSSAHLVFMDALSRLFGWTSGTASIAEEEFFDILLHIGTLIAVIGYFRLDLTVIILTMIGRQPKSAAGTLVESNLAGFNAKTLPWQIALSTVITVGFVLVMLKGSEWLMAEMGWATPEMTDISEFYRLNPQWVAVNLMVTGALLFFTEWVSARKVSTQEFQWKNALVIGLFQGVAAIFRGVSRSGSTISGGLISGLDRVTATRYAFLMSIPAFLMALVYELKKMNDLQFGDSLNWPVMIFGMAVSAVVGYLCIKYFIQYVARHSLKLFAVYCWCAAVVMLFLLSP